LGIGAVALVTTARSWRGSATVLTGVARGLAGRGHAVHAFVAHPALEDGFRARGIPVTRLAIGDTGLAEAWRLRRALRGLHAAVALVDKARDVRLAALAAVFSPLRIVYCISTPSMPGDPLTRWLFRRVALTVFLTEGLERSFLERQPYLGRRPHTVIHNGVDVSLFRPDPGAGVAFRRRIGVVEGPLLVAVAALHPEKRLDWLLDAVALLNPGAPPVVICGAGAERDALAARAERLGLDLRLPGYLAPGELIGAYNAATVVVHARPDEGFPLSIAEALACGRPVLAVEGGGTPEVLGDAGVVVPRDPPRGFAVPLGELLVDPARREALGAAARRRAVERFGLERMQQRYADAVEALVSAR